MQSQTVREARLRSPAIRIPDSAFVCDLEFVICLEFVIWALEFLLVTQLDIVHLCGPVKGVVIHI